MSILWIILLVNCSQLLYFGSGVRAWCYGKEYKHVYVDHVIAYMLHVTLCPSVCFNLMFD